MAHLVGLDDFSGRDLELQLATDLLRDGVGNRIEASDFIGHHGQQQGHSATEEAAQLRDRGGADEIGRERKRGIGIAALGSGIARMRVPDCDRRVDYHVGKGTRPWRTRADHALTRRGSLTL